MKLLVSGLMIAHWLSGLIPRYPPPHRGHVLDCQVYPKDISPCSNWCLDLSRSSVGPDIDFNGQMPGSQRNVGCGVASARVKNCDLKERVTCKPSFPWQSQSESSPGTLHAGPSPLLHIVHPVVPDMNQQARPFQSTTLPSTFPLLSRQETQLPPPKQVAATRQSLGTIRLGSLPTSQAPWTTSPSSTVSSLQRLLISQACL